MYARFVPFRILLFFAVLFAFGSVEHSGRVVEIGCDIEKLCLLISLNFLSKPLYRNAVAVNRNSSQFSFIRAER